ncbi:MAG TPA: hypothetical protein VM900_08165 [Sphingomonas sp.]|nr:hypothetical protein [Sphingomonas sp.]
MIRVAALIAGAVLTPAAAAAQDQRGRVEQIGDRDNRRQPTEQVETVPARASAAAPAQLSTERRSADGAAQLTARSRETRGSPQLSTGPASAEASAALSTPAQGRTAAVTRVEGSDRCGRPDAAFDPGCRDILENRADEFARRDPNPLTPEQRLLIEQRARQARMTTPGGAAQRLAEQGDAGSEAGQGIASVVLARPVDERPARPSAAATPGDPGGLGDIADAIISGILTLPAAPPPPQ